MCESCFLLLLCQTVEEFEQGDRAIIILVFLESSRSLCAAIIADPFALHDYRLPIGRFREREDVIVGEAYSLSDFKGNGNPASLAENLEHIHKHDLTFYFSYGQQAQSWLQAWL